MLRQYLLCRALILEPSTYNGQKRVEPGFTAERDLYSHGEGVHTRADSQHGDQWSYSVDNNGTPAVSSHPPHLP